MQVVVLLWTIGFVAVEPEAPPEADVIEHRVLDQRLALTSGRITLTVEEASSNLVFHCVMLFDGPKRRFEITRPPGSFPAPKDGPGGFSRLEKFVVNHEQFLHHMVDLHDNPGRYVAHVEDLHELHELERTMPHAVRVSRYKQALDPRVIGLATQSFGAWWYVNLTQLVLSPSQTERSVSVEQEGEQVLWRVTRRYPSGDFSELWIDPGREFNVVRKRTRSTTGERVTVDEISVELTRFPSGDEGEVWFPSVVRRHVERPEGNCCESVIRVESAEFNRPVPERLFQLEGLDLPIGTLVAVPKSERIRLPRHPEIEQKHKRWDGDTLAPLTLNNFGNASQPVAAAAPVDGRSRSWPWIVGINLILLGVLLLVAWGRRVRSQ